MAQTTVIESKKLSGGVTDHDALNNLDYASAGHTGFEPAITEIAALPTTENDTTKILQPDGLGGLQWNVNSGGVTEADLLNYCQGSFQYQFNNY